MNDSQRSDTEKVATMSEWKSSHVFRICAVVVLLGWAAQPPAGAEQLEKYTETLPGTKLSFEMVLIPGGKFKMGSPDGEAGRKPDEGPVHEVSIAPFYLATTEMRIEIFMKYYEETVRPKDRDKEEQADDVDAVTGPTPVYGDLTMGWGTDGRPAIAMTWKNAVNFCRWLSEKTGKKYRLPTEAEWEYACRAGTTTAYFFGNDASRLGEYAWFENNASEATHPAAQKKPNPWGLYDMLGNVREWVQDFYSPDYYKKIAAGVQDNPAGPAEERVHVARGGAWDSPADELRSAARGFEQDWWRAYDPQWPKSKWWLPKCGFIGFRVARPK